MQIEGTTTYLCETLMTRTCPIDFDADDIGMWGNAICFRTNDTCNMRSVTTIIVVGLVRISRPVRRCSTADMSSSTPELGV